jgi:transposase
METTTHNTLELAKARRLQILAASQNRKVVDICREFGISRSTFYNYKRAYDAHGEEGLKPQVRAKPNMPNKTPPEIEAHIVKLSLEHPKLSYLRIGEMLNQAGIKISGSGVRKVWKRHGLSRYEDRELKRLEQGK